MNVSSNKNYKRENLDRTLKFVSLVLCSVILGLCITVGILVIKLRNEVEEVSKMTVNNIEKIQEVEKTQENFLKLHAITGEMLRRHQKYLEEFKKAKRHNLAFRGISAE